MRAARRLLLLCAALAAAAAAADGAGPAVQAACGRVEGVWESARGGPRVAAFRGIPYGEQGRFERSRPAACWEGAADGAPLNASANGPVCWQAGGVDADGNPQAEDCLNLNVFSYEVPDGDDDADGSADGGGVPVIVWIYGGSLMQGSTQWYGAVRNLAEPGRAVLVALNYRLAAFGFLALRELSEADPLKASGNLGIGDQQLALRWVQENIAAFGGDPGRVTLLGQSSGGTSILALLASPGSRGLFHGAVSLSGSPNMSMPLDVAERQNRRLLLPRTPCGGAADVRACLLGMDAEALAKAAPDEWYGGDDFPSDPAGIGWPGLAIVDGVVVTRPLVDALRAGVVDVPVILQNVQAEDAAERDVERWNSTEALEWFERDFEPWGTGPALGRRVYGLYGDDLGAEATPAYRYYATSADTGVTCGTVELARAAAGAFSSPVYVSLVLAGPSRPYPMENGLAARYPYHMWDYIAAAETWQLRDGSDEPYRPAAADLQLGAMLREQWYTLAAHGSLDSAPPNVRWRTVLDGVRAPSYVHGAVAHNATQSRVNLKSAECDFWKAIGVDERFWWAN